MSEESYLLCENFFVSALFENLFGQLNFDGMIRYVNDRMNGVE